MAVRRSKNAFVVLALHLALWLCRTPEAAWSAAPGLSGQLAGWTDTNGNGSIDCAELVTLRVAVFDNAAAPLAAVSGVVTVPSIVPAARWTYIGGSARVDPVFNSECGLSGPLPVGSGPADNHAEIPFTCTPTDSNYVGAFLVDGYYLSSGGGPIVVETAATAGSQSLANTIVVGNTTACPPPADLRLVKTAQGSGNAGTSLTYTLTAGNFGNGTATGAEIRETVPAGTVFAPAASSPGWSCLPDGGAGSACTLPLGALAPNATLTRTFGVTVLNPLPAGLTQIRNTACAATTAAEGNPANDCGTVDTPANGTPDLVLTKTVASGDGQPGALLSYTLTVANAGGREAAGVVLTESIPPYTAADLGAGSPGWSCSPSTAAGGECTLSLGTLGAGAPLARTFAVRVVRPLPAAAGSIDNTACVADDGRNGVDPPGNNCASRSVPALGAPLLSLIKVLESGSAVGGGLLTYRLDLTNGGDRGAQAVVLTEAVPEGTTFEAAASSPGWSCAPSPAAGADCTLPLGTLEGGQAVSRTFSVRVDNPLPAGLATIGNTACAGAGGPSGGAKGLPCSTVITPTGGNPDLSLGKSADAGTFAPGGTLRYTLVVANGGTRPATGVTLTETVPAATSADLSAGTHGWSCSPSPAAGSTCTFDLLALPPGGSTRVDFAVRVADPLPAGTVAIDNTACVSEDGRNGVDPEANDCSSVSTPRVVPRTTDLELSLAIEPGRIGVGERGRFGVLVHNASETPAHGVRLLLYLPAGAEPPAELDPRCALASERAAECDLGTILPGTDESVTGLLGAPPGTYVLSAEVTACDEPDRDSTPNNADPAEDDWASAELVVADGRMAEIPTLNGPGLCALALLLPLAGWSVLRLRRRPSR